jgi:H+/Cl- antiporter ClcA
VTWSDIAHVLFWMVVINIVARPFRPVFEFVWNVTLGIIFALLGVFLLCLWQEGTQRFFEK